MPSRVSRVFLALLAILVAAAAAVAPIAAATVSSPDDGVEEIEVPADIDLSSTTPTQEPGRTVLAVQLQSNGDARWTVSTALALRTETDEAAFEDLAEEFEDGGGPSLGLGSFERASEAASDYTGREMSIVDENRSSIVVNDTGYLVLEFTWTNFSRQSGTVLAVDDVFRTESGTWLSNLEADQTLIVRPPEGYAVTNASTGPVNGVLRWDGPETFEPGELSATYRRIQDTPSTGQPGETTAVPSTNTTSSTTAPTTTTSPIGADQFLLGGVLAFGIGIAAVVAYVLSRDGTSPIPTSDAPDDASGATAGSTAEGVDEVEEGAPPAEDPVAEELLSDEERVEHLLERNGGRMKQADIVDETGWSNAKVSQLLSAMEEEGRIDKLRIGRENLISFPDEDVGEFE